MYQPINSQRCKNAALKLRYIFYMKIFFPLNVMKVRNKLINKKKIIPKILTKITLKL